MSHVEASQSGDLYKDSQLVINQMNGEYETKEEQVITYLALG